MSFDNNPTAVRVYALQEAVKYYTGIDMPDNVVVDTATKFLAFLNGSQNAVTAEDLVSRPATTTPKSAKSAKAPVTPAKPVKVEPTAEEIFEDRKAKIGEKVAASLAADKRAEAVAIMEGYGAKSVTQLAQGTADLAEILGKFDEMLLAA